MGISRYVIIVGIFTVTALALLKRQTDESEVISFQNLEQDAEKIVQVKTNDTEFDKTVEEVTESLPDSLESTPALSHERTLQYSQDQLSEEQIAEKITQAKIDLARVEGVNVRKNAQFERLIAKESSVELPLLEAELAYRIEGWRSAWEAGNIEAYLSFYGEGFSPSDGKSLEQWKNSRAKLVSPKRAIQLELRDFSVSYDESSSRSLVRFTQYYKSGNFEETVGKRLILASQNDLWKIISETTE